MLHDRMHVQRHVRTGLAAVDRGFALQSGELVDDFVECLFNECVGRSEAVGNQVRMPGLGYPVFPVRVIRPFHRPEAKETQRLPCLDSVLLTQSHAAATSAKTEKSRGGLRMMPSALCRNCFGVCARSILRTSAFR